MSLITGFNKKNNLDAKTAYSEYNIIRIAKEGNHYCLTITEYSWRAKNPNTELTKAIEKKNWDRNMAYAEYNIFRSARGDDQYCITLTEFSCKAMNLITKLRIRHDENNWDGTENDQ